MARFALDKQGRRSIIDLPEGVRPRDRVRVTRKGGGVSSVVIDLLVTTPAGNLVGYTKGAYELPETAGKGKFDGKGKFAGKGKGR